MKKITLLFLALLSFTTLFSQIEYESGYYIDNYGNKIEGLIENRDWQYTPSEFKFKTTSNSESQTITYKEVQSFKVAAYVFEKYILNIDKVSKSIDTYDKDRNANFTVDTLFLRKLVEGKANLYLYESQNSNVFFYSIESNTTPKQLVYKPYYISYDEIRYNNEYKQELYNSLKCEKISEKDALNLNYYKSDLINYFEIYNSCFNDSTSTTYKKERKNIFNISPRIGADLTSLEVIARETFFEDKISPRIGLEFEYFLNFNKNKWSILFEPNYSSYNSSSEDANIEYSFIGIPIGIRHYFYLNDNTSLFLNSSFSITHFDLGNKIIEYDGGGDLNIESANSLSFGLGFKYKKAYIELRHVLSRDLLNSYYFQKTNYTRSSIIIAYNIF